MTLTWSRPVRRLATLTMLGTVALAPALLATPAYALDCAESGTEAYFDSVARDDGAIRFVGELRDPIPGPPSEHGGQTVEWTVVVERPIQGEVAPEFAAYEEVDEVWGYGPLVPGRAFVSMSPDRQLWVLCGGITQGDGVDERADRYAAELAERGVAPGEVVTIGGPQGMPAPGADGRDGTDGAAGEPDPGSGAADLPPVVEQAASESAVSWPAVGAVGIAAVLVGSGGMAAHLRRRRPRA